eukprot:CAMPEP_0178451898 /NCGR_PEP_ID=MMETSP0689_2-20121128/43942_1 /TAXON_ID=160604 /ORGANISM="Amphidinium massartii, Strain CS-259" /LENGTH=50 /DNA_ID=CAMNT_0020077539 /DNA_START=37 /DNA_END=185 /DNA_ORIENTATION=+
MAKASYVTHSTAAFKDAGWRVTCDAEAAGRRMSPVPNALSHFSKRPTVAS